MRYQTENEWNTFDFRESYVGELRFTSGMFQIYLDNVKILEQNSCNRDVHTMRANGLEFRIVEPKILEIIEEGCKIYNADGVLQQEIEDRVLQENEYASLCEQVEGAILYGLKKEGDIYEIGMDGEEHAYTIRVAGSADIEEWDRFLNLES